MCREQPDRGCKTEVKEKKTNEAVRYGGNLCVTWSLVGGQNGKIPDGAEETLLLLLLGIDIYRGID